MRCVLESASHPCATKLCPVHTHTHTHTSAAKRVRGGLQPLVSLLSLLTEASRALDEHCVGRSGIAVRRLFERRLP